MAECLVPSLGAPVLPHYEAIPKRNHTEDSRKDCDSLAQTIVLKGNVGESRSKVPNAFCVHDR